MFDTNTNFREQPMNAYQPTQASTPSAVAATVTTLVSAWFLVAGATMVASPTDTQVARGASVTVKPGAVLPVAQPLPAVAIAPEAQLRIVVQARRA
jgi:hypothetical protein